LFLFRQQGNREKEEHTLLFIGLNYLGVSDYEQALEYFREVLDITREIGDLEGERTILQIMAWAHGSLFEFRQSLAYSFESLELWREIGDPAMEAELLFEIGKIYGRLDDYHETISYCQQAIDIWQETGDEELEADALVNIALALYHLSDFEQAMSHLQQALDIQQDIGDREGEGRTLNVAGMVYDRLNDDDLALDYYEQALAVERETGNRKRESEILGNIAAMYLEADDQAQALPYYEQALAIQQELDEPALEAASLNGIGAVYFGLGDYQRALTYYEQALPLWQEVGDRHGEAVARSNIGLLYRHTAAPEQSLELYQQSLGIMQELGDRAGEAAILSMIGNVHEIAESYPQAVDYYLRAISVLEDIRASASVEAIQTALAGVNVEVYQRAVRLLVELDRNDEAFSVAERSRARTFLDGMGNGRPDLYEGVDADLLRQEEVLRGELAALERALVEERSRPAGEQDEQVVRSIEEQLADKQQEYEELLARLQLANPELASLVTVPTTAVSDIQALLDERTTLVVYYLTDENGLAFVVAQDVMEVVVLPVGVEEIAQAVEGFRSLGLANLGNPYPRSLSDLYAWLVEPLLPYMATSHVGIIPHQTLHYVPFAALNDGEEYFGEQYTLFHLPSASVLPFIQDKVGREYANPVVMGDPQTDAPDLPELAFAVQEAEQVAALLGTVPLLEGEASESALRTRVGEAGVVHLAAHGSFNLAAPLFSRLWLAPSEEDDGRLNVHEVYGLDLDQADLVVLSACETQVGELSAGDEVVGLNRAFLYSAPTVMASLWAVDDEATGTLMGRFYTHLSEGMGKAEALQMAQEDVRTDAAHPEWAHPYYWAGFVLSGDPGMAEFVGVGATTSADEPEGALPATTTDEPGICPPFALLPTALVAATFRRWGSRRDV
jgi:CHAT domain-containing protein/Tfp pilus assembly protein PilF